MLSGAPGVAVMFSVTESGEEDAMVRVLRHGEPVGGHGGGAAGGARVQGHDRAAARRAAQEGPGPQGHHH